MSHVNDLACRGELEKLKQRLRSFPGELNMNNNYDV